MLSDKQENFERKRKLYVEILLNKYIFMLISQRFENFAPSIYKNSYINVYSCSFI